MLLPKKTVFAVLLCSTFTVCLYLITWNSKTKVAYVYWKNVSIDSTGDVILSPMPKVTTKEGLTLYIEEKFKSLPKSTISPKNSSNSLKKSTISSKSILNITKSNVHTILPITHLPLNGTKKPIKDSGKNLAKISIHPTVTTTILSKSINSNITDTAKPTKTAPTSAKKVNVLLTLFTCFRPSDSRQAMYNSTLQIWSQLGPEVKIIFYCDMFECGGKWIDLAKKLGWTVREVPAYLQQLPVLKYMFLDAMKAFDSIFYGFANADILFDSTLIKTLKGILPLLDKNIKPFIIGRRTDVNVGNNTTFASLNQIKKKAEAGKLFTYWGEDYFITTKKGFPWKDIPDFVVGRRAYDNWLVRAALKTYDQVVIEATKTLTALHQSDSGANKARKSRKHTDINVDLTGRVDYSLGVTTCAPVETFFLLDGNVSVRNKTNLSCVKSYKAHKFTPRMLP